MTASSLRVAGISYHSSPLHEPGSGDSGGMTIYIRELARALSRSGVATDIYTRREDGTPRVMSLYPRVRVVSIDAGPRAPLEKHDMTRYLDDFARGIEAFRAGEGTCYDIVHSHYWQSGLIALTLAERWDVPLVHSQHTLGRVKNLHLPPDDRAEPLERIEGETRVITHADALVASTPEERRQLQVLYGASDERVKVVHAGVDHALFQSADRMEARRAVGLSDELAMLYVGRIQPLKGLDLALRAFAQLVPAVERPLVFLIVGGASGRSGESELRSLRALVDRLGLRGRVRFVGPQPHRVLPAYYRAADALVVCSHSESFGLAALEAQACGTPVVATNVGGLREVVVDSATGFLVETRDPVDFAARLKTLLSDDGLRAAFRRRARERSRRFSWAQTAAATCAVYESLVDQPGEMCAG